MQNPTCFNKMPSSPSQRAENDCFSCQLVDACEEPKNETNAVDLYSIERKLISSIHTLKAKLDPSVVFGQGSEYVKHHMQNQVSGAIADKVLVKENSLYEYQALVSVMTYDEIMEIVSMIRKLTTNGIIKIRYK